MYKPKYPHPEIPLVDGSAGEARADNDEIDISLIDNFIASIGDGAEDADRSHSGNEGGSNEEARGAAHNLLSVFSPSDGVTIGGNDDGEQERTYPEGWKPQPPPSFQPRQRGIPAGVKALHAIRRQRPGRAPVLSRAEVEAIRSDMRRTGEIARYYGVSDETIRRVKQIGRYKDVPYIPVDEYKREITLEGMKNRHLHKRYSILEKQGPAVGRKLAKREPLGAKEVRRILLERHNLTELADELGISKSTLYRIKRVAAASIQTSGRVEEFIRENPSVDINTMSHITGILPEFVLEIRKGYRLAKKLPNGTFIPAHYEDLSACSPIITSGAFSHTDEPEEPFATDYEPEDTGPYGYGPGVIPGVTSQAITPEGNNPDEPEGD